MDKPFQISVIIPVYNGEQYIESAIRSAIAQTYPAKEIIIVNDGSTDNTSQIVDKFSKQVIHVKKEHSGLGDSSNQGIACARGDFIAFLDADDMWVENKHELQLAAFIQTDVDMVFGYVEHFISPELDEKERSRLLCPDEPMPGYTSNTMLVKKETVIKVGLFSTEYRVGEFIDWYMRAKNLGLASLLLPETVAKRRLHKSNMTGQDAKLKVDYARLLKAGLDHRRAQTK